MVLLFFREINLKYSFRLFQQLQQQDRTANKKYQHNLPRHEANKYPKVAMYKFNYKSVQNMQCLVTQILLNNMLKFHSDMAKHMFKIGFLFEIQVHSS